MAPAVSGDDELSRCQPGPHCANRSAWNALPVALSRSASENSLRTPRLPRAHPRREWLRRRIARDTPRGNADCSLWHPDADSAGVGSVGNRRRNCHGAGSGDRRVPDGGGISGHRDSRARECRNTHGAEYEPLMPPPRGEVPFPGSWRTRYPLRVDYPETDRSRARSTVDDNGGAVDVFGQG